MMKKFFAIILTALMLTSVLTITDNPLTETKNVYAAVKLNKKSVSITKGKKVQLKVIGTKKKAKWTSSAKSVATVNSKGLVTGKKKGTAKITAKIGKKKYTCKVTVKNPASTTVTMPRKGTFAAYPNASYSDPNYLVNIKSINNSKMKFSLCRVGRNASPIYDTETITVSIKKDKTATNTFKWEDSWFNEGTGQIKFISKNKISMTIKQTYTSSGNRLSLECKNLKFTYAGNKFD